MSSERGVSLGKGYAGQAPDALAQQLARLRVDERAFTFQNGLVSPRALGRVADPTGDTAAEATLRTLLGLLRSGGYVL